MAQKQKRVLFISSSGGHWIQLLRLAKELEGCEEHFASTDPDYQSLVAGKPFYVIPEGSRWSKWGLLHVAWSILWLLIKVRPEVVITTGAAPGFFALLLAKKLRMKTVWLDSIANIDEVSLSGRKVRKHADLWLTQWEHLQSDEGPECHGKVI